MGKAKDFLSSLGNGFLEAGSSALTGGFGGIISNGIGSIVSSLFGPSVAKQIRLQKEAQMELNQQAAELNYEYGEKSAENAYNRQLEMYQRSYEDQSYEAMRKQMEDANLSVGLMYGQGASGGGAGSMNGAPQGQTGGAIAGDAAEGLALSIEMQRLKNETTLTQSQANLNNAEAEKTRTLNKQENINLDNLQNSIDVKMAEMREHARGMWIDNNMKAFTEQIDAAVINSQETIGAHWTDKVLGQFTTNSNSVTSKRTITGLVDELMTIENKRVQNGLIEAEEAFKREETASISWKTLAALIGANAAMKSADAANRQAAVAEAAEKIQEFLKDVEHEHIEAQAAREWVEAWSTGQMTDFSTGGWGKSRVLLDGLSAIAWAYVGAKSVAKGKGPATVKGFQRFTSGMKQ